MNRSARLINLMYDCFVLQKELKNIPENEEAITKDDSHHYG